MSKLSSTNSWRNGSKEEVSEPPQVKKAVSEREKATKVLVRGDKLRQLLNKTPFDNVEIQKLCDHYHKARVSEPFSDQRRPYVKESEGMCHEAFRQTFGMTRFLSNRLFEWVLTTPDLINLHGSSNIVNPTNVKKTKSLSFEEFIEAVVYVCPRASDEEKIRLAFSLFDRNQDGYISQGEFESLLMACLYDETKKKRSNKKFKTNEMQRVWENNRDQFKFRRRKHRMVMPRMWGITGIKEKKVDYQMFKRVVQDSKYYTSFIQALTMRKHWLLKILGAGKAKETLEPEEDALHDFLSEITDLDEDLNRIREILQDNLVSKVQDLRNLNVKDYVRMGLKTSTGQKMRSALLEGYTWEDHKKLSPFKCKCIRMTILWLVLILGGIVGFLLTMDKSSNSYKKFPSLTLLGYCAATVTIVSTILMLLSQPQRLVIDRLRRTCLEHLFPLSKINWLSKICCTVLLIAAITHVVCYTHISKALRPTGSKLKANNISGGLALICLCILTLGQYAKTCEQSFANLLNKFGLPFYSLLVLHCLSRVYSTHCGWLVMSPFFLLNLYEWWISRTQGKKKIKVSNSVVCFGRVIKIEINDSAMKYLPGQYVKVRCPKISRSEWRNLYITSAPSSGLLSVHVEVKGKWSNQFYELYRQTIKYPLYMIGPFGPGVKKNYRHVILIASAQGSSPMASVVQDMVEKLIDQNSPVEKIYFYWILKHVANMQWFLEMVDKTTRQINKTRFETEIFLMSGSGDLNIGLNIIMGMHAQHGTGALQHGTGALSGETKEARDGEKTGPTLFSGGTVDEPSELTNLVERATNQAPPTNEKRRFSAAAEESWYTQSRLNMCRPDFHRVFQKVRYEVLSKARGTDHESLVGVYYFGDVATSKRITHFCTEYSDKAVTFELTDEIVGENK